MKTIAQLRLAQFDAMDAIDLLNGVLARFKAANGRMPQDWSEVVAARLLRGIPVDPAGVPFAIDSSAEVAQVAERSPLTPMPPAFVATPRR